MNELESWAVAALAIVDNDNITPLLLRCYTSSESVVEVMSTLTDMSLDAHLYVGPEDVIRLHLLILSSLDRCDAQYEANSERLRVSQVHGRVNSYGATTTTIAKVDSSSNKKGTDKKTESKSDGTSNKNSKEIKLSTGNYKSTNIDLLLPLTQVESGRWVTATTDIRYTGQLQHDERFTAFGFCGANRVKVLLVTVGEEPPSDALVPLCRTVYEHAMWHLCNPFHGFDFSKHNLLERQIRSLHETINTVSTNVNESQTHSKEEGKVQEEQKHVNVITIEGMYDDAWPTSHQHSSAAPCIFAHLSTSVVFNTQLHSLLSPFTVTSRSVIVNN